MKNMEKHRNWFCYLWLQPAISSSSSGRHGKQVLPKLRPWILPREKDMVLIVGKVHLCENLGTVTTQTIDILAFWFANGLLQSWTGRRLQARSILETKTLSARTLLGTFGVCIIQLCMLHFFCTIALVLFSTLSQLEKHPRGFQTRKVHGKWFAMARLALGYLSPLSQICLIRLIDFTQEYFDMLGWSVWK